MTKPFQNLARKESRSSEDQVQNRTQQVEPSDNRTPRSEIAIKCLNSNLAAKKEWGARLSVCERVVLRWARKEQPLPESRAEQILLEAKFFMSDLKELDQELDRILFRAYGGKDRGNF